MHDTHDRHYSLWICLLVVPCLIHFGCASKAHHNKLQCKSALIKYCLLMENTVILTVCADNSKLTLLWVSLFVEYLGGVYMTPFSTQKQTVGHRFGLSALSIAYLWRIQWYWILTLYVLIFLNWLCYECRFFVEYMAAFTWFHFQHKKEHLVTVLSFRLHANDENAYSKPETFESGDLSGDLENGYLKNGWLFTCKHPKMNTYILLIQTYLSLHTRKKG